MNDRGRLPFRHATQRWETALRCPRTNAGETSLRVPSEAYGHRIPAHSRPSSGACTHGRSKAVAEDAHESGFIIGGITLRLRDRWVTLDAREADASSNQSSAALSRRRSMRKIAAVSMARIGPETSEAVAAGRARRRR